MTGICEAPAGRNEGHGQVRAEQRVTSPGQSSSTNGLAERLACRREQPVDSASRHGVCRRDDIRTQVLVTDVFVDPAVQGCPQCRSTLHGGCVGASPIRLLDRTDNEMQGRISCGSDARGRHCRESDGQTLEVLAEEGNASAFRRQQQGPASEGTDTRVQERLRRDEQDSLPVRSRYVELEVGVLPDEGPRPGLKPARRARVADVLVAGARSFQGWWGLSATNSAVAVVSTIAPSSIRPDA